MTSRNIDRKKGHITVCICTFRRLALLERTLLSLRGQVGLGSMTYSIVVSDNDSGQSGQAVVEKFSSSCSLPVVYVCEPVQNIALARNRALAASEGEFIAFIDDDEFPQDDWLSK
ncbi:MAG TPA: glycosyltransferase family A protein, partial [Candidatus Saccharibacteria bacterium]|nr:glycosyltransferase family A protein [Candidatus Saccharibacteria bacterium]